MGRGKRRCSASACAIAISMILSLRLELSPLGCAWTRGVNAVKETWARTYLFLHIMRLGPAACSGGAAVFFLAIGPSEGVYGANKYTKRTRMWLRRI